MSSELTIALVGFAGALAGGLSAPLVIHLLGNRSSKIALRKTWIAAALGDFMQLAELEDWDRDTYFGIKDSEWTVRRAPMDLQLLGPRSAESIHAWMNERALSTDRLWLLYLKEIAMPGVDRGSLPGTDKLRRRIISSTKVRAGLWARGSITQPSWRFLISARRDLKRERQAIAKHDNFMDDLTDVPSGD